MDVNDLKALLDEGTVRGVLVTLVCSTLLILGKKTWTWLRTPCPLGPLVQGLVTHFLHGDRVEDSERSGENGIITPKVTIYPHNETLRIDGKDIWDTLSRGERKAILKAHSQCLSSLRTREMGEDLKEKNRLREEAERALLPFVSRRI